MSLTTCVKKAGKALSAEDKSAILEAARVNRKAGMSVDAAAKAAVQAQIDTVQALIAQAQGLLSTKTVDQPATLKERAAAMAAKGEPVHQDPGEAPEVATKAVVAEAIKTAADNRDRKPSEMREQLLRDIQAALVEAPDYSDYELAVKSMGQKEADEAFTTSASRGALGEKFTPRGYSRPTLTFRVPGDGAFTVNNTVRQLLKFRRAVESSPGFRQTRSIPAPERATDALDTRGPTAAIKAMIDEGDPQAAVDYAAARGLVIADVLKGDKVRLPKVAGLTPTAEAVGEFEPEVAEAAPAPSPAPSAQLAAEAPRAPAPAPQAQARPPAPTPRPAPAAPARRAPKSFRKSVKVTTQVFVEDSNTFEQREVDADSALTALAADIKALQAFRACIGG
jgi:two-component system, chemotaxis family, sensor kinase CheA